MEALETVFQNCLLGTAWNLTSRALTRYILDKDKAGHDSKRSIYANGSPEMLGFPPSKVISELIRGDICHILILVNSTANVEN